MYCYFWDIYFDQYSWKPQIGYIKYILTKNKTNCFWSPIQDIVPYEEIDQKVLIIGPEGTLINVFYTILPTKIGKPFWGISYRYNKINNIVGILLLPFTILMLFMVGIVYAAASNICVIVQSISHLLVKKIKQWNN